MILANSAVAVSEQTVSEAHARIEALLDNIETVVYGKREVIRLCLVGLFARGHLLIEDIPGIGKTTLAQALALSIESESAQIDIRGSKILVVDDNPQNLELVQAYLETMPVTVATAADGVAAIAEVERFRPDLVLLDVMMPKMSGFEVCQKIKGNPALRDTVIIMVTALHEVGDFERAVECGCDDFLTKPVNKLELVTRVKSLLRVRTLKRMLEELKKSR